MATTELRSLRITPELDAGKYTAGANQKVAADRAMAASNREVAASATDTSAKISQAGDVLARLSRQYVDGYASAQRFNSALSTLSRGIDSGKIKMEQAGAILDGIYKKYGLMAEASQFAAKGQTELANAITAANAKLAAQRQIAPANGNNRGANFAALNATSQFQDIAITSAMGQSPLTIALQQGTQLGQGLQMALGEQGAAGAAKVLGSAVLGLFSPINLVAIGLTAVVAAGIQFGSKLFPQVKSLDDLLKQQTETVRALGNAYGDVAEKAKMAANSSLAGFGLSSSSTVSGLRLSIADQVRSITSETGRFVTPGKSAGGFYDIGGEFKPFADAIDHLRETAAKGSPDVLGFKRMVEERWALDPNNAELTKAGAKLEEYAAKSVDAAHALQQLQVIQRELFNNIGPNGLLLSQGTTNREDMANLSLFRSQQQVAADRARQSFAAQTQASLARSPQELAAAARAQAQSTYVEGESNEDRNLRVGLAGKRALVDAENALKQAQVDRYRALDQAAASQQLELDLIGKTTGEAARMRLEFERLQQLREDAARNHTIVDPAEVERIKAAAAAAGQLADAVARAKLGSDLSFERDQLFRTGQDQQIASRLRSAGLPVDLDGQFAQQMRDNQQYGDARDAGSGFAKTFGQEVINSGGNIGKSLGKAIESSLLDATQKAWERLADQLGIAFANWLTGGSGAGNGAAGSASTVIGSLLGGGAANDNSSSLAGNVGSTIDFGRAVSGGGAYSVANATNFIKQYAAAIGIDPGIALKVAKSEGLGAGIWQSNYVKDGFREPSFGPLQLLKGGPGTGFGKGLGNRFMEKTGLEPADPANWQQSTAFGLDQAKANGWGAWFGAKKQGITGFDGIDQTFKSAAGAVDRLKTSSIDAAQSLSGGLGKLGNSLSQFPAAPGGGAGGLLGGLGGLLGGGLSSIFSGSKAFSWLSANPGGYVGLYADGTENAPPGWAWVGERGPELRKLRAGDVIRSNPKSMQMAAANGNSGGMPAFAPVFNIDARNSTMSRAEYEQISRQQSEAAIASYHKNQERGGFGGTQKRYANNKG